MRTLKISLLVFILSISISAQESELMYKPVGESKIVQISESFESIIEVKCFEEKSDPGSYFILLDRITNFSSADIIWELSESVIYSHEEQFKPTGYQIIINIDHSLPKILNLRPIEEIGVKGNTSLSILMLFSKWQNNDRYETLLDDRDADIIVGTAHLKRITNEKGIFRMIFFKKAD
jgi:hypothetical protein